MQNGGQACLRQYLAVQALKSGKNVPETRLKAAQETPKSGQEAFKSAHETPKTRPRHALNPPKSSSAGSKAPPACNLHKELRLKAFIIDFQQFPYRALNVQHVKNLRKPMKNCCFYIFRVFVHCRPAGIQKPSKTEF